MIYRLNYDKPHRCPRWSGSGWRNYPWEKIDDKCDGMSFPDVMFEVALQQMFGMCNTMLAPHRAGD